jgi:iron complex outermembrane receptor protein
MAAQSGRFLVAAVWVWTCMGFPAFAQSASGGSSEAGTQVAQAEPAASGAHENILDEIVVTSARKREENVQTTPIAVTAMNADLLERDHVTNLTQVGTIAPNLFIAHQLATPDVATIYLRGFGEENNQPDVDPHVAVFLDGIYQPSLSGTQLDTFDLGSIEVDAGPQGTLLGKNAPIGAIYVTSARPTGDLSGAVEGEYGSYDHFVGRAKLNFPIWQDATGDTILAAKVSFVEKEGGNWIKDILNGKTDMGGENEKGYRVGLLFTPSPDFEWLVNASLLNMRDPQSGLRNTGFEGGVPGNASSATQPFPINCELPAPIGNAPCRATTYGQTAAQYTQRTDVDSANVSSEINWKLTPVTLTSLTGYLGYWGLDPSDVDGTPYNGITAINDKETHDLESEEFRISSAKNGGWDLDGFLDWVIGGYASNESYTLTQHLAVFVPPGSPPDVYQGEAGTTQSEAAFAHVIANFTDQWTGTFGVRDSWDKKWHQYFHQDPLATTHDIPYSSHNLSFEVGTAYQFDENHMAYVRFAQGYAAGGFAGLTSGTFNPETNNAYEIGFKTDWLNKRLRVNLAFFDNELSALQVSGVVPDPGSAAGFKLQTTNAGAATVEGFESQIVAVPTENLTTHLNLGYLHPKYDKFFSSECVNPPTLAGDCSGLPFSFASKWTINLGADYVQDLPNGWGTATFSADWDYRSGLYTSDPPFPGSYQEGYGLVDLGVKLLDSTEKYSIEFFGTNVLNRKYKGVWSNSGGITQETQDGRPAEWGIRVGVKFGPFGSAEPPSAAPAAPPPEAPPAPPAPVAKAPEAARQFQVFFDFDKSDITSAAAQVIEAAAEAVKAGNVVRLTVTGHTDTVGSAKYNQALSERRAAAVKGQLVTDGVASGEITATGVGKSGLLVPTADGVREPQNRRAEIVLQ